MPASMISAIDHVALDEQPLGADVEGHRALGPGARGVGVGEVDDRVEQGGSGLDEDPGSALAEVELDDGRVERQRPGVPARDVALRVDARDAAALAGLDVDEHRGEAVGVRLALVGRAGLVTAGREAARRDGPAGNALVEVEVSGEVEAGPQAQVRVVDVADREEQVADADRRDDRLGDHLARHVGVELAELAHAQAVLARPGEALEVEVRRGRGHPGAARDGDVRLAHRQAAEEADGDLVDRADLDTELELGLEQGEVGDAERLLPPRVRAARQAADRARSWWWAR